MPKIRDFVQTRWWREVQMKTKTSQNMRVVNQNSFIVALVSIPLYISLLGTCIYYALRFWDVVKGRVQGGLYGTPKFYFFVVLGISACLDIPTFLACVGKGGPTDCIWNDNSYAFVWSCHLIATCGYLYAVITPSILWSDIIRQKDGNFWNSASPLDGTKIFFRVAFVIYCCVIFTNVLGVIIYSKSSDESSYSNSNTLGAINNCLMPIMLVIVTLGCLYSGMRLRQYVMNVQLGNAVQLKILLKLNFTMITICVSYVVRALLVMSLYDDIPQSYVHAMKGAWQYPVWIPLTQWIPFLFCSFCLVNEMKFHGVGKDRGGGSKTASQEKSENLNDDNDEENGGSGNGGGQGEASGGPSAWNSNFNRQMSIDSVISEIARSEVTRTISTRSRSHSRSTKRTTSQLKDADDDKFSIAMTDLVDAEEEGEEGHDASKRTFSADNYFDAQHVDDLIMSDASSVGSDHFFTTSAMHLRS